MSKFRIAGCFCVGYDTEIEADTYEEAWNIALRAASPNPDFGVTDWLSWEDDLSEAEALLHPEDKRRFQEAAEKVRWNKNDEGHDWGLERISDA